MKLSKQKLANSETESIADPPPPYEDAVSSSSLPNQSRTLHIYYESWKSRTVLVKDSDKETLLYEIDYRYRRPQITLREPNSTSIIGTLNFYAWSGKIEADIHGQHHDLRNKCWKYSDIQFRSKAFGGQLLTWKQTAMWKKLEFVLLDEKMEPVAKFSPNCWSFKKAGTMELVDGAMEKELVDEILTTGLAVLQDAMQRAGLATATTAAAC